jgi:hypothetical protein
MTTTVDTEDAEAQHWTPKPPASSLSLQPPASIN